jgi:hypothetical protein
MLVTVADPITQPFTASLPPMADIPPIFGFEERSLMVDAVCALHAAAESLDV